jgi:hypothetical protein
LRADSRKKERFAQQKQRLKEEKKKFHKTTTQKKLSLFPRGSLEFPLHCEVARALKKEETFND